MKTKELIEELEAMAYKPERITTMTDREIIRITREGGRSIAIVDEKNEMAIDTKYVCFRNLSSAEKHNLYSLLTEYASTPLEEREEPKKYIYALPLKVKGNDWHKIKYLMRRQGELWFDDSSRSHVLQTHDFHFADAEVESYPEDIQALFKACNKELVECTT